MFNKIFNIKIFNNIQYIKKQNIFNKFRKYIIHNGYTWYPLTLDYALATGITDPLILTSLNNAEGSLISSGYISKIKAWHPMLGGTASTCKYNFMDARDLDAAYRLTFNGGWTFSANGALPNGINAYANTHYTPSVSDLNSFTLGYYSRTNASATEVEMGCSDGVTYELLEINTGGATYAAINNLAAFPYIDTDSLGMYIASRTASNLTTQYKNEVSRASDPSVPISVPSQPIYLGAFNNIGIAASFTTKECATAIITEGLTNSEAMC